MARTAATARPRRRRPPRRRRRAVVSIATAAAGGGTAGGTGRSVASLLGQMAARGAEGEEGGKTVKARTRKSQRRSPPRTKSPPLAASTKAST